MFHAGAFHQLSRNLGLHGHEPGILYELHQLDDGLLTHYLSLYMMVVRVGELMEE